MSGHLFGTKLAEFCSALQLSKPFDFSVLTMSTDEVKTKS
jgi:hypothetical protein